MNTILRFSLSGLLLSTVSMLSAAKALDADFALPPLDIYEQCSNPRVSQNPVRSAFCSRVVFTYVCPQLESITTEITDPEVLAWDNACAEWEASGASTNRIAPAPPAVKGGSVDKVILPPPAVHGGSTNKVILPPPAAAGTVSTNKVILPPPAVAGTVSTNKVILPPPAVAGTVSTNKVILPPPAVAGTVFTNKVILPPPAAAGTVSTNKVILPPPA